MTRASCFLFAVVTYVIFFVTFLYFAAFVGNFPFAAVTVDRGGISSDPATAILIDIALIALFGVQHSVMARPAFKAAWTKTVAQPLERSIYVLASTLVLIVLMLFWHPLPTLIWAVESHVGMMILWTLFGAGWLLVLLSTFLINHFELFGLQQAWCHMRGSDMPKPKFRQPALYRFVRHPLYVGFLFALWAIPVMTAGHLLLAAGMSAYILIGVHYEERDLGRLFGQDYEAYRARVGMLAPRLRR